MCCLGIMLLHIVNEFVSSCLQSLGYVMINPCTVFQLWDTSLFCSKLTIFLLMMRYHARKWHGIQLKFSFFEEPWADNKRNDLLLSKMNSKGKATDLIMLNQYLQQCISNPWSPFVWIPLFSSGLLLEKESK